MGNLNRNIKNMHRTKQLFILTGVLPNTWEVYEQFNPKHESSIRSYALLHILLLRQIEKQNIL